MRKSLPKHLYLLVALLALAPRAFPEEPRKPLVLFDFDQGGFDRSWKKTDKLSADAAKPPESAKGEGLPLPAGLAAKIDAPAQGRLVGTAKQVPADWLKYEEMTLWTYRSPDETRRAPAVTFDVVAAEEDGVAHFWRRVDLKGDGWQKAALPLRWFRQGPGRIARWDRIDRVEFRFRAEAHLWMDSVALLEGKSKRAAELSEDDLRGFAFPAARPGEVRAFRKDHALILTDVKELDLDKLGEHLKKVSDAVLADMPFLEKPQTPPVLIVFSTREQFQAFPPALAKQLNAQAAPPQAGGFTIMGIATSFWDPLQGTLRPVYAHEFVHGLLERSAHIGNKTEWFQEGLANWYQLKFHPQKNLGDIVRSGVANPKMHLPLRELLSGNPIPTNRHWQAVTVVDTLLANAAYRKQLGDLLKAFQKAGSTDLGPHLKDVLKTDWDGFEKTWRRHCEEAYPADKPPRQP